MRNIVKQLVLLHGDHVLILLVQIDMHTNGQTNVNRETHYMHKQTKRI